MDPWPLRGDKHTGVCIGPGQGVRILVVSYASISLAGRAVKSMTRGVSVTFLHEPRSTGSTPASLSGETTVRSRLQATSGQNRLLMPPTSGLAGTCQST